MKMLKVIVVLFGVLAAGATSLNAEVVEIALPGLLGNYPLDDQNATRSTVFQLPAPPVVIHGASFRVSGTTAVGSTMCEGGEIYPWPLEIAASMEDVAPGHLWITWGLMPEESGPFGWTGEFQAMPSTTTWGFLMDGEAEITLYGAPTGLVGLCWPVSAPPTAIVEEAVLIVDAEFAVPVAVTSWGRIKALYDAR